MILVLLGICYRE